MCARLERSPWTDFVDAPVSHPRKNAVMKLYRCVVNINIRTRMVWPKEPVGLSDEGSHVPTTGSHSVKYTPHYMCLPVGGATRKVWGFPKQRGFIFWRPGLNHDAEKVEMNQWNSWWDLLDWAELWRHIEENCGKMKQSNHGMKIYPPSWCTLLVYILIWIHGEGIYQICKLGCKTVISFLP